MTANNANPATGATEGNTPEYKLYVRMVWRGYYEVADPSHYSPDGDDGSSLTAAQMAEVDLVNFQQDAFGQLTWLEAEYDTTELLVEVSDTPFTTPVPGWKVPEPGPKAQIAYRVAMDTSWDVPEKPTAETLLRDKGMLEDDPWISLSVEDSDEETRGIEPLAAD